MKEIELLDVLAIINFSLNLKDDKEMKKLNEKMDYIIDKLEKGE